MGARAEAPVDRVTLGSGTPISLQLMFVLPFTHFDPPTFPNGGAMVPIHITSKTTSNSSHQHLKPGSICVLWISPTQGIEAVFHLSQRLSPIGGGADCARQRLNLSGDGFVDGWVSGTGRAKYRQYLCSFPR
jgi:hypothetical protein